MNKNEIIFSENRYRYIILVSFKNVNGEAVTSYFRSVDTEVHSTTSIWSAERFFSKKEAEEAKKTCKATWPDAEYTISKAWMSAVKVEED